MADPGMARVTGLNKATAFVPHLAMFVVCSNSVGSTVSAVCACAVQARIPRRASRGKDVSKPLRELGLLKCQELCPQQRLVCFQPWFTTNYLCKVL